MNVVACGARAIPALRELLFQREPSGLYQPRCLAVDALAALGAKEVLLDFLDHSPRDIEDPIERTGEDAVINAAARALASWPDDRFFAALLRLVEDRASLAGVIEALGDFRRPEALPALIKALGEDFSRDAAEAAIRKLGINARPALVRAATLSPCVRALRERNEQAKAPKRPPPARRHWPVGFAPRRNLSAKGRAPPVRSCSPSALTPRS